MHPPSPWPYGQPSLLLISASSSPSLSPDFPTLPSPLLQNPIPSLLLVKSPLFPLLFPLLLIPFSPSPFPRPQYSSAWAVFLMIPCCFCQLSGPRFPNWKSSQAASLPWKDITRAYKAPCRGWGASSQHCPGFHIELTGTCLQTAPQPPHPGDRS